jgi:pre-60S factor REI1
MRGDWHRYNLQRRMAGLAPLPSEIFNDKVLQARADVEAQADKARYERACQACSKTYYSENSFQNHLSSKRHKAKAVEAERRDASVADEADSMANSTFSLGPPHQIVNTDVDSDAEEEFTHVIEGLKNTRIDENVSPVKRPSNPHLSAAGQHKEAHPVSEASSERRSDTDTPTPSKTTVPAPSLKSCLFCNYNSPSIPLNVVHMQRFHGMFIPERNYLVDLDGLLSQLEKRVRENFQCVFCAKVKGDVYAVQAHMRDLSHCKIPYFTLDEQADIGEFYDFRATYSDSESEDESMDEDRQNGGAKLGAKRATIATASNGDVVMEEEDGWETDSSASSLDSDDLHAVPAENHYHQYERLGKHPHHSQTDPRAHHQRDGWHSHAHKHAHAVFYDEYELHLPNGKSVGNRAWARYYRQNLRNYPSPGEAEDTRGRKAIADGDADAMDVDRPVENGADARQVALRQKIHSVALARSRGHPENSYAALRHSGDKHALARFKQQERQAARNEAVMSKAHFKFKGSGINRSANLRRPVLM